MSTVSVEFLKDWTAEYIFTGVRAVAVCLICKETVAIFKEFDVSRHFPTKHANQPQQPVDTGKDSYCSKVSTQFTDTAKCIFFLDRLFSNRAPRQVICWHPIYQRPANLSLKGSFKTNAWKKQASLLCPESKNTFEQILSHRTRCTEVINEDLATQLDRKAESFQFYCLALDESNDINGTVRLFMFIRGNNDHFEIREEFYGHRP